MQRSPASLHGVRYHNYFVVEAPLPVRKDQIIGNSSPRELGLSVMDLSLQVKELRVCNFLYMSGILTQLSGMSGEQKNERVIEVCGLL